VLKLLFLTTGEVKTTSPIVLALLGEAKLFALLPSASLAPESVGSEAMIASVLAHNGALIFRIVAKITSTIQCFSSSLATRDFASISKC